MKMYAFPFKWAVACCDNRYNPRCLLTVLINVKYQGGLVVF